MPGLELSAAPPDTMVQVRLDIRGIAEPLVDPRLPQVVVAARRYRRCDGVTVHSADNGWRFSFITDKPVAFLADVHGVPLLSRISAMPLKKEQLEIMAQAGAVVGDLFAPPFADLASPGVHGSCEQGRRESRQQRSRANFGVEQVLRRTGHSPGRTFRDQGVVDADVGCCVTPCPRRRRRHFREGNDH